MAAPDGGGGMMARLAVAGLFLIMLAGLLAAMLAYFDVLVA